METNVPIRVGVNTFGGPPDPAASKGVSSPPSRGHHLVRLCQLCVYTRVNSHVCPWPDPGS